ncbi:MAG: hypothetical protein NUW01_14170 [Gemmatimonadaceae bacterium]|nr:hypothetical protein [Gemmatimonadaceae bacterium]
MAAKKEAPKQENVQPPVQRREPVKAAKRSGRWQYGKAPVKVIE